MCTHCSYLFWMTLIQANIDATTSGVWTSSRIGGKVANESDGPTNSTLNKRPVKQIVIPQDVIRVPNSQWSTRKRIGQFFAEWSPWTSCDSQCRQRRERFCKVLRKCADTKHVEERQCSSNYMWVQTCDGLGVYLISNCGHQPVSHQQPQTRLEKQL